MNKNDRLARQKEIYKYAETYVLQAGIKTPPVDPMVWCENDPWIEVRQKDLRGECDGILRYRNNWCDDLNALGSTGPFTNKKQ